MLTIRDEMRQLHPGAGPNAPWEFIMMYLVSANQEGLTTIGTHRLLTGLPPVSEQTIRDAVLVRIGRAPGPLSPPTMTQSILVKLIFPRSSSSGS